MCHAWLFPCPWAFETTIDEFLQLSSSPSSRYRFSPNIPWIQCHMTKLSSLLPANNVSIAHAVQSFSWLQRSTGDSFADSIKTWHQRSSRLMSVLFWLAAQENAAYFIKPNTEIEQPPDTYHLCL